LEIKCVGDHVIGKRKKRNSELVDFAAAVCIKLAIILTFLRDQRFLNIPWVMQLQYVGSFVINNSKSAITKITCILTW